MPEQPQSPILSRGSSLRSPGLPGTLNTERTTNPHNRFQSRHSPYFRRNATPLELQSTAKFLRSSHIELTADDVVEVCYVMSGSNDRLTPHAYCRAANTLSKRFPTYLTTY